MVRQESCWCIGIEEGEEMIVVRKDEGEVFIPSGHEKMSARKLFGPENGSGKAAVHHSVLESGGGMKEEVHESSDQIFYILSGRVSALSNGSPVGVLEPGDSIHIKAGEYHSFRNNEDSPCSLYVITVPPIGV